MRKNLLLIILLSGLFAMSFPSSLRAHTFSFTQSEVEIGADVVEVHLSIEGTNVRVQNASGLTVEVYNITGVKVLTQKVDSSDKTVSLSSLGKGCYIIKVGKLARKISIL